ncbi:MAG TPA: methyltransferase domain-containing protein [Rudaea sp.]
MSEPHRLYARPALQALFARELAMLAPILGGVFGNRGLFLRPHPQAPRALPAHLLATMHEFAVTDRRLEGVARCDPDALPFANDVFKLVIAQHVFEQVDDAAAAASELSRVLAPEGVALVLGFNPASPWRIWLSGTAARAGTPLTIRSAQAWQQILMREQIDTLQIRYPGRWWPRTDHAPEEASAKSAALGRFSSSWLLLARKRRSTLTPLRLKSGARERSLNPRLAPGAHRQIA